MDTPVATYTTELPPCCVQVQGDVVIIGTYKLEQGSDRWGSVDVLICRDGGLEKVENHTTKNAILDIKFNPNDRTMMVLAHSEGNLDIWKFNSEGEPFLKKVGSVQVEEDKEILITLVHFSGTGKEVLVTLTSGYLAVVDLATSGISWLDTPHDLECWTADYSETLPSVVYTGGDDAKLIAHDLRTKGSVFSTGHRHHEAGVVAILSPLAQWNSGRPHQLWTGSYDDHLRVLDLRVIENELFAMPPVVNYGENLGGGVWRLIPKGNDVLTCCMYDGGRVINSKGDVPEVTRTFKGNHESMVYGADWFEDGRFVTCSFYDKVVHLWE